MQVFRVFHLHVWCQERIRAIRSFSHSSSAWSFPLPLGARAWGHHRGTHQRVLWSQDRISVNLPNLWAFHPGLRAGAKFHYSGRMSILRGFLWECCGFSRWRHKRRSLATCPVRIRLSLLFCVTFSRPSPWYGMSCCSWGSLR